MNKFKKGDIIKGVSNYHNDCTNRGMKEAIVLATGKTLMYIKILKHTIPHYVGETYTVENTSKFFALIPNKHNKQIHIMVDGTTTIGVLKENGKIIKRSEAKLHPDDNFNFETGVNIVLDRLFDKETTTSVPSSDDSFHLLCQGKDLGKWGELTNKTDMFGEQLHIGDTVNYLLKDSVTGEIKITATAVVINNNDAILLHGKTKEEFNKSLPFMLNQKYTKFDRGYRYPGTNICIEKLH